VVGLSAVVLTEGAAEVSNDMPSSAKAFSLAVETRHRATAAYTCVFLLSGAEGGVFFRGMAICTDSTYNKSFRSQALGHLVSKSVAPLALVEKLFGLKFFALCVFSKEGGRMG